MMLCVPTSPPLLASYLSVELINLLVQLPNCSADACGICVLAICIAFVREWLVRRLAHDVLAPEVLDVSDICSTSLAEMLEH